MNSNVVVKCYHRYISYSDGEPPSQAVFLANIEEKLQEDIFLNDTHALLRPSINYNPREAYKVVKRELMEKIENT